MCIHERNGKVSQNRYSLLMHFANSDALGLLHKSITLYLCIWLRGRVHNRLAKKIGGIIR